MLHPVFAELAGLVESRLRRFLAKRRLPGVLREAMEYTLFAGGKRLRPSLALLTCDMLGGERANVLPAACALEMVHTYSLIHDDLPAMDDDEFRRGRPTAHRVFGEAAAVLAGDGLLTDAFLLVAAETRPREVVHALVSEIAAAAGSGGMVGGQVVDVETSRLMQTSEARLKQRHSGARRTTSKDHCAEGLSGVPVEVRRRLTRSTAEELVEYIHEHKTAALIRCSVRVGALAAGAAPGALLKLGKFGGELGIAFQIVDDILDTESTTEELGKTAGKDARDMKLTYPLVHGLESSRRIAGSHIRRAERLLSHFKPSASAPGRVRTAFEALHELCGFMLTRKR